MSLNAFLNPITVENKKVVISNRFVENGKPVEWEIKTLSEEEEERIRRSCIIKNKKGHTEYTEYYDENLYISKLATACVIFPDLENIELQNAYKAMGAESLLKKMLYVGEYVKLLNFIKELNEFDTTLDDLVDEAKN